MFWSLFLQDEEMRKQLFQRCLFAKTVLLLSGVWAGWNTDKWVHQFAFPFLVFFTVTGGWILPWLLLWAKGGPVLCLIMCLDMSAESMLLLVTHSWWAVSARSAREWPKAGQERVGCSTWLGVSSCHGNCQGLATYTRCPFPTSIKGRSVLWWIYLQTRPREVQIFFRNSVCKNCCMKHHFSIHMSFCVWI